VGPFYLLKNFSIQVTCQVTQAWPQHTVISGEGITDAVAGVLQTFNVTLYDSGNNRLTIGGDTLTVTFTPAQSKIEIFDRKDGSYLVQYLISKAGSFTLSVSTNLDTEFKKTSSVIVVPN